MGVYEPLFYTTLCSKLRTYAILCVAVAVYKDDGHHDPWGKSPMMRHGGPSFNCMSIYFLGRFGKS